ncbi:restriction endonuclease subunit S [Psychrobacter namhaensis]|uniref:restriction endonuclease subunit S n=1 Tax=Psychrobacter namhaensis TaxID=292734 RepID=UPI003D044FD7
MATPKLRFKEFDEDWTALKYEDILNIKYGKDHKKLNSGNIPVFGTGGVMRYVDQFLHDGESILIGRKGTIDSPKYVNEKFWTVDTLFYTEIKEQAVPKFVYQHALQVNWLKLNEATGVPSLNTKSINNVAINLPPLKEQTKIATFLSAVDTKIDELTQKHELLTDYKKGMMQQIFSQKVRFKADDGSDFEDWTQCTLSEIATRVTRKNKEGNQNPLTISAQMGLVNQQKYFNKQVASKNLSNYYLLYKGEYAYNKSYSAGYPMGVIKRLKNYDKGAVSTLYICFSLNNKINTDFFEHYVESGNLIQELEKIAQEGARNHGLLNVGIKEFFEINLSTPCLKEQTKIANFLTAIDQKIDNVAEQIDHAKTWKKGLLQQMFV